VFLLIALIFYPKDQNYSIYTHTMSYLGNYKVNPGWIFFSMFVWVQTFTVIPIFQYLKRHMSSVNKWANGTSVWMYYISFITMFLIGCFPDTQDHSIIHECHIWVAVISYTTYAIAGMLFWIRGRRIYPKFPVGFLGLVYYILTLFMFFSQLYAKWLHIPTLEPGVFSFPMWEWILYFLYLAYFYSLVLGVPEKSENKHP
jgi:hypothetical membrane protein